MLRIQFILCAMMCCIFGLIPLGARGAEFVASFGGTITAATSDTHHIYLAQRDTIIILDKLKTGKIRKVGQYTTPHENIRAIAARWPVVYYWNDNHAGSFWAKFRAIDITTPTQPREFDIADVDSAKSGAGLRITGNQLFVHGWRNRILDIADPFHPKAIEMTGEQHEQLNEVDAPPAIQMDVSIIPREVLYTGSIVSIKAKGDRVNLLRAGEGIDVLDVSNPRAPRDLGSAERNEKIIAELEAVKASPQKRWFIKNKYKVCKLNLENEDESRGDLVIQDIFDPKKPRIVATLESEEYPDDPWGPGSIERYWMSENLLYVVILSDRNTGMAIHQISIWDLADPEHPKKVTDIDDLAQYPEAVSVSGKMVYLAEGENGLSIYKID